MNSQNKRPPQSMGTRPQNSNPRPASYPSNGARTQGVPPRSGQAMQRPQGQGGVRGPNAQGVRPQTGMRPQGAQPRVAGAPNGRVPLRRPVGSQPHAGVQQRPMQASSQGQSTQMVKRASNFADDFNLPQSAVSTKSVISMIFLSLLVGLIMGLIFFSGSSQPVQTGLQGVIRNRDITSPLPRCGRIDKGQACVLYIMNSSRYDRLAESFFEEALKLTEVALYSIRMANPKYAKQRIPAGHFVEIKIPNVR